MIYLLTGIIAAIVHVVTGPDHLAAVTPLAIESKKKSWSIGLSWGIGHTFGMLLIGLLFIIFKQFINIELISSYGELIVGFLLIGIGVWAIAKIFIKHGALCHTHVHPHVHEEEVHIHFHSHETEEIHKHTHKKSTKQNILTAFGIGILHGVAGVSHLFAVLPTIAFPSKFDSTFYLTGFGLGTLTAMIVFAMILGIIGHKTSESKKRKFYTYLRIIGGSIAIAVGIMWIVLSV